MKTSTIIRWVIAITVALLVCDRRLSKKTRGRSDRTKARARQFDRVSSKRPQTQQPVQRPEDGSTTAGAPSRRSGLGFKTVTIAVTDSGGLVICDPGGFLDIRPGEGSLEALQRILEGRIVREKTHRSAIFSTL
jgi:hypothetical protein